MLCHLHFPKLHFGLSELSFRIFFSVLFSISFVVVVFELFPLFGNFYCNWCIEFFLTEKSNLRQGIMSCFSCCDDDDVKAPDTGGAYMAKNSAGNWQSGHFYVSWSYNLAELKCCKYFYMRLWAVHFYEEFKCIKQSSESFELIYHSLYPSHFICIRLFDPF